MDTIFALASAQGKAGVAVVRISGPDAFGVARRMAGSLPEPRKSGLRTLTGCQGNVLDEALVLCFQEGASFTGEDVVEFHLHGSIAVIAAVQSSLASEFGLRAAEAGEFTRRALENNRLDLAQVEGLADLIDAETEAQRRLALQVLSGSLGNRAQSWRSALIRAAALLEATIDFADEEVPVDVTPEVRHLLTKVDDELGEEIKAGEIGERVRVGFEVAIVGPPNAGKSTLLNALAGRDAAITSEYAGTTRDVIEVRMDLGGLPVTLLDTAGLRETTDFVEELGIKRARSRAELSDLRVFLVDGDFEPGELYRDGDLVCRAKADLHDSPGLRISGQTGEGVGDLIEMISHILSKRSAGAGVAMRLRHRVAMQEARRRLSDAMAWIGQEVETADLIAEDLRAAIRALDSLVGLVDVEDLLDEIFSSFCIGK